jgi:hypothetical protein
VSSLSGRSSARTLSLDSKAAWRRFTSSSKEARPLLSRRGSPSDEEALRVFLSLGEAPLVFLLRRGGEQARLLLSLCLGGRWRSHLSRTGRFGLKRVFFCAVRWT